MRVAMEAASLSLSSGGLARYTGELSGALARCFPDDEFFLVSDQPFSMPRAAPANLKRGGTPRTAAQRRWWLWGLSREARRLGADVIHGPDFAAHVARSFTLDGAPLACGRRPSQTAHSGVAKTANPNDDCYAQRDSAPASHGAIPD
jgi:hypothetical protein